MLSRGSDAGLACGQEHLQRVESADAAQRWGAVEHPKVGNREERRQVDWRVLSAHKWVRQSRRTPQVTDHGLLSERK